ncbi:MAG: NUDIX hydrolase [Acidobacteria bacterium]|nr:NUDIX hydrolase [Acidobacteriota bacterium]
MVKPPVVCLSHRAPYRTRWLRVEEHRLRLRATGQPITYSFIVAARSVSVVAVTAEKRILILRQYRYPTRGYNYELPGGGAGRIPLLRAAQKELEEETGRRAGRLRKLGEYVVYSGLSSEICHVFLATNLRPGRQQLEETEHLTVHEVTWPQLQRMVAQGRFRDGMGLASLNIAGPALRRLTR